MTVRGIEAIKLYIPPNTGKLDGNIKEEKDSSTTKEHINSFEALTMTSVERYRREWEQLLETLDDKPESIRDLASEGHLKISKFRSIYWALLLRVLNEDHRTWCLQREQQRNCYNKLKEEFARNPHNIDNNSKNENDDPLSQSSQSVWNQYFSDQELFGVIRQDVVRTFPGVDFFRKPLVQNAMCNILFYYAREHPYMCYRQGMHEILAPVIFVMYGDHQSLLHFKEIAKDIEIDGTLINVLNPSYLEADSYFIFSRIMASTESYYRVSTNLSNTQNETNSLLTSEVEDNLNRSSEIEVVGQLNFIRDKILAKEDLHLHNYLMKLDIPLHIFGIRWLRLLFGREFALLDLLVLWDAIFSDGDRFDLPNYIVVAMLIRIRDKLLLSDYTSCLTHLMRYPANVDINLILRHALHMQMPKKYERPTNAFIYFNIPPSTTKNQSVFNGMRSKKGASNCSNNVGQTHRTRSTSLGDNATHIERQITLMQTRNAADEAMMAKFKQASDENHLAMDGYKHDNPELILLELKNAQTVIRVARIKLQTYLNTIRHHMSKRTSREVQSALDGVEELCQFLDVEFIFPLHSRVGPIDQALEANEQQLRNQLEKTEKQKNPFKIHSKYRNRSECTNIPVVETNGNEYIRSYEKPDNGFMLQSTMLLGNIKEIELRPIVSDEKVVDPQIAKRNLGLPVADPTSFNS